MQEIQKILVEYDLRPVVQHYTMLTDVHRMNKEANDLRVTYCMRGQLSQILLS